MRKPGKDPCSDPSPACNREKLSAEGFEAIDIEPARINGFDDAMSFLHDRRMDIPEIPVGNIPVIMVIMGRMKATVELPDELLISAKKRAAELRWPLRALIEEGLS